MVGFCAHRDALDLFRAGFPAGTVTGRRKIPATMQIIDDLEPVTRGFYPGSIGRWSFGGDFDSCITLRSVHVHDAARVVAGVCLASSPDSDPVAEYREVFDKTRIARARTRNCSLTRSVRRVLFLDNFDSFSTTSCICSPSAWRCPRRDAQ